MFHPLSNVFTNICLRLLSFLKQVRGCLAERLFEEIALAAQDIGGSRAQDIGEEEMSVEQDIGRHQVRPDSFAPLPIHGAVNRERQQFYIN